MQRGILLFSFLSALLTLGCGGSSSETPWPREPEGPALGPAGESGAAEAPADEPAGAPERPPPEEGAGDADQEEAPAAPPR